ncbi:MAG: hypothetical protein WA478_13950, partial [Pseudolabrys sp.]
VLSGIVIIRRSMDSSLLEDDNLTKGWAKREKGTTIVIPRRCARRQTIRSASSPLPRTLARLSAA